ncbi:MAG: hypothetical protein ACRBCJ_02665 [Hyphomicrobiaceae bacterium]
MQLVHLPQTLANWTVAAIAGIAALAVLYSHDQKLLMPGPVSTVHSSIDDCKGCHTNIKDGALGWLHGLVRFAKPEKDSQACLSCHKIGDGATTPHSVSAQRLKAISNAQENSGSAPNKATIARIANVLFPHDDKQNGPIYCATCHKEHRNDGVDLSQVSQSRCHTCHRVQFEKFATNHPEFKQYPFKRRTRLAFDHAAHFEKRFPETRKKKEKPANIPNTCADCHTATASRNQMGVKPFSQSCSQCHLSQIVGTNRATGPQGLAFITLPGLDLETLQKKGTNIGQWPTVSEADVTPIMKLMLGRDRSRRKILMITESLDLLDLSNATDDQIAAVEKLAWEIKGLIYTLTTSRTSDVIKQIGGGTRKDLDHKVMAQLIAAMPRDVLINAQREWLPNLKSEIEKRGVETWVPTIKKSAGALSKSTAKPPPPANQEPSTQIAQKETNKLVTDPKFGGWKVDPYGELVQDGDRSKELERKSERGDGGVGDDDGARSTNASDTDTTAQDGNLEANATAPDDVSQPEKLTLDAEAWAEFGGWYRKDFAILYKPTGHGDRFVKAWLDFSGHYYKDTKVDLAAAIFSLLTDKDAQGQCTKCHSVEKSRSGARLIQWRPSSASDKMGQFTTFAHEPHFGLLDERGCLTCHKMSKSKDFEKSYQSLDPKNFVSNFKPVEKKLCATCHKKDAARQDCLLCHKYHANPVVTPITSTKLPK